MGILVRIEMMPESLWEWSVSLYFVEHAVLAIHVEALELREVVAIPVMLLLELD